MGGKGSEEMGCDIHLYVEKRDVLGQWQSADTWEPNKYYEDGDEYEPQYTIPYENRFYSGRNYGLFAILADVRNGVGFAGVKTGKGFNPIAPPRGLPDMLSEQVRMEADSWNGDGHNHSWFTLQELLDYDWTQYTDIYGWLHTTEFDQWDGYWRDQGENPQSWSADVSGSMVEKIDEDTMRSRIKALRETTPRDEINKVLQMNSWYTHAVWKQYYYQVAKNFLGMTIPRLLKLAEGDYASVRIVFWFDN